ncbi:MAG: LPXTG cell wall anchor domain-containing protein [Eubacteriales bacterium]
MRLYNRLKRIIVVAIFLLVLFTGTTAYANNDSLVVYEGSAKNFVFVPETTDLFQNLKNIMPGDELAQEIIVRNTGDKVVKVYLRAEAVEEQYRSFLSQLSLKVVENGEDSTNATLFEATADQQDTLVNNVLLGTVSPGVDTTLHVTLDVPRSLGDEYQNTKGVIKWVFTVEETDEPDTPKTGDDSVTWIWYAVLIVAVIAFATALIIKKKKKAE